ncbi:hypothetical protein M0802_005135 [Mischocyttarus mexicanus]|nr:hypothetical protein M0802_016055 [Mischocyttarus mexicanus]KAI4499879.1 hypothetical protein M0802_005135 [Mischocyttarus mexicanus]
MNRKREKEELVVIRERVGVGVQQKEESGSAWAENRAPGSLVDILPSPGLRHSFVPHARGIHRELESGSRSCAIGRPLSRDPPLLGRL